MNAPERIYVCANVFPSHVDWEGSPINTKRIDNRDIEYTRTDVIVKDVKRFLAEIHRVCDITDENGYRIELRELQARFENFYKETKI